MDKKKNVVWTMQDYGNLEIAEYLYKLGSGGGTGSGTGLVGTPGEFSLEKFFPGQQPGVSTVQTATGVKPTPAVQATAQDILKDPKAFAQKGQPEKEDSLLDTGKRILASIFDYEDEKDLSVGPVNLSAVESVWDGFLKTFDWGYNKLSQATSAGLSALPGGIRTLTWDEAANVSVGQTFVGSIGESIGKIRRGEATGGDIFAAIATPLNLIGTAGALLNPESEIQQKGWDITKEEDRKVFEEGPEKFFSGLTDFGFVFADPLIIGGALTKLTRLRFIDRPLDSENAIKTLVDDELMTDIAKLDELEATGAGITPDVINDLTPVGRFVEENWGQKTPWRQIAQRGEIKDSTHAEAIALGVSEATSRREAALIIASAAGDKNAYRALREEYAASSQLLEAAERRQLEIRAAIEPQKWKTEVFKYKIRQDRAIKDLDAGREAYKRQEISGVELKRLEDEVARTTEDTIALERGIARDPAAIPFDQNAAIRASQEIDALQSRNKYLQRALEVDGSLRQANRGFASNTRLGKAVSNRRARLAESRYDVMSNRGTWSPKDFFTKDGLRRTLRVWKYTPGLENPAYYISLKGTSALDVSREAGSVMDTLKMFSGEGKTITRTADDGSQITEVVGGRAAKEQILADFSSAVAASDDVAVAAEAFENAIQRQIRLFYDMEDDVMDYVLNQARRHMNDTAERIKDPKRRWFPDESSPETIATMGRAPFLESQLIDGMYMLPYDELERIMINLAEGKVKNPWSDTMSKGGRMLLVDKALYTKTGLAGERLKAANDIFQSFWRPAVLFRLGYPQRNVTEGVFRSIVFNQSLAPLWWTTKGFGQGFSNFRRAQRAERKAQKYAETIKRAQGADDPYVGLVARQTALVDEQMELTRVRFPEPDLPDSYKLTLKPSGKGNYVSSDDFFNVRKEPDGWRIYERNDDGEWINASTPFANLKQARETLQRKINEAQTQTADFARSGQPRLADINRDYGPGKVRTGNTEASIRKQQRDRDRRIEQIEDELEDITVQMESLGVREMPAALKGTKFDKWRTVQLRALQDEIDGSIEFEGRFLDDAGGWEALTPFQQEQLIQLRGVRRTQESQYAALMTDDYYALSEYTSTAARKRRVDTGKDIMLDNGAVLSTAFGNDRYRDIAQKLLSSDNTIKATLSVRANLSQSLWLQKQVEMFVEVFPDQGRAYWEGMQEMLQQYSQSRVGQMIAAGESNEKIVSWLLGTDAGRKWRDTLDSASEAIEGGYAWGGKIGESSSMANAYIDSVRESLEYITLGDPRVLDLVSRRPPKADELQRLMGSYDNLNPVVGNKEQIIGYPTFMDTWRKGTEAGFRVIGTLPEDSLVRGPFYSQQYLKFRDSGLAILREQYADDASIPLARIEQLEKQAHRRALKDTKEFLYTIDRRTNLGRYGEWIFPFISATQNSVTTLGKLVRRDPALPALMLSLWSAPTRVGWEDENGNLIIPLPKELIPDSVEDFFGLQGITDIRVPKAGLNVVFPETGFAFVPRPTPLVQVGASELMKRGLLIDVTPPPLLVNVLGTEQADQLWRGIKDYIYGEENGISNMPLSFDKFAPPVANRLLQLISKDSSAQYAYQYALQARTEDLRWRAGERDDYPTSKEIMDRTNGQFLLRMLGNIFAFTPPDYQYAVQPLIDMQRKYDKTYGLEGPMKFSEQFGNEVLILSNTDTTKNVGGALSNMGAVRNIQKYDGLIRGVAPRLGDDLSILGIIVNDNAADAEYDPSSYRWMTSTSIPGTSRNWRELLSGPESMRESQRTAGWVEFTKFMGTLDAMLTESGYSSYRVKGASELNDARQQFIENMKNNPMYEGWRIDYEDIGGKKNEKALMLIQSALNDEEFMKDKGDNRTWQAAAMYIEARDEVMAQVAATGKTINHEDNKFIAEEWDSFRMKLKNYDNGWAAIANRFLNADDDPRGSQSEMSFFQGGM